MRFLLVTALAAALLPVAAPASTGRTAHVFLLSSSPVVIRGTSFRSHERVVVTVSARGTRKKVAIATARGAFRLVFKGYSFTYCEPYTVSAKGNRGSTAFVKVIPECPSD